MREVTFVKQGNERWKKFEHLLIHKDTDNPDEISSLYIQLIDDLSYARTFYPQSPTYKYLNELSGKAHQVIYKNKKERRNRLITFWKSELPFIFFRHRRQLLIAFLIFAVATIIGIASAANDDSFVRLILGDEYVDMTIDNIKNGNPLGVYNHGNELLMFFMIAKNNITVSFMAFAMGLLFSVGTIYFLFENGIMLGAFQYFFFQYGVLKESLLTIWLHGTIEISVCIVSGCAGLVMGNSILFPGTFSRGESFRNGATNGLKMVVGTVPFFIIAAFIESFITRHARYSQIFDGMLILLSLTLILGYFVIYPAILNRRTTSVIKPGV